MLCAATASFSGCGETSGDHPPVYSVKGKVLYKGKPVSAGVVLYELEAGDPATSKSSAAGGPLRATGRIEADGSFRLVTYQDSEGVPAGNYRVGISSVPPRSESNILDAAASARRGNPDVLGGRYADPKNSGLRTQVSKDQPNEHTFDLK
jgi:hypothetical protein